MALPILDGNQTATTLSTVLTSGEHIPAHTVVSLGSVAISNITSAVSGSVVSVSNLPSTQTIAGTVTANVPLSQDVYAGNDGIRVVGNGSDGALRIGGYDPSSGVQLNIEEGGGIPVFAVNQAPLPITGTVTANLGQGLIDEIGDVGSQAPRLVVGVYDVDGTQLGANRPFPISGTVTANNPNGSLTTRFGSVATANLAFITSAVTNTSRKYLLAQNISAGTVTIGIGFSPTTTQGIQLPAGGGLTFDAFCPTGAVYWLGAVTGAAFTILEG